MSKNVMILFSGGLDSTYLMWKNLKDGNKVHPVYLEITNNDKKTLVEKQQIELIVSELNKEFDENITIDYATEFGLKGWNNNVSFTQPLIWSLCMAFAVGHKIDEVHVGYVKGDDALLYLKEIKKLYYATKPFTHETPKLKFPLVKQKLCKDNMLDVLPDQYHRLIISCEDPILNKVGMKYKGKSYRTFEPCCTCVPCKKNIANHYYGSKIIRKKYNHLYYEWMKKEVKIFEIIELEDSESLDLPCESQIEKVEYDAKG